MDLEAHEHIFFLHCWSIPGTGCWWEIEDLVDPTKEHDLPMSDGPSNQNSTLSKVKRIIFTMWVPLASTRVTGSWSLCGIYLLQIVELTFGERDYQALRCSSLYTTTPCRTFWVAIPVSHMSWSTSYVSHFMIYFGTMGSRSMIKSQC